GASSDFSEGEWRSQKQSNAAAVPDPTSVLAPPPMLLATDGGAQEGGAPVDSGAADAAVIGALPGADCAAECEQGYSACRKDCKAPACDKACAPKYKRCMKRCF